MDEVFPYVVRFAKQEEWDEAMQLAWDTFLEFEARDYTREGIRSFEDFISDATLKRMFGMGVYQMFVAYSQDKIVGMITLRNETHISLLFVDKKWHRHGVGRALINHLCDYLQNEMGRDKVTVNSAPYGIGFYHKLGFEDLGPEMQKEGIRYTPMQRSFWERHDS